MCHGSHSNRQEISSEEYKLPAAWDSVLANAIQLALETSCGQPAENEGRNKEEASEDPTTDDDAGTKQPPAEPSSPENAPATNSAESPASDNTNTPADANEITESASIVSLPSDQVITEVSSLAEQGTAPAVSTATIIGELPSKIDEAAVGVANEVATTLAIATPIATDDAKESSLIYDPFPPTDDDDEENDSKDDKKESDKDDKDAKDDKDKEDKKKEDKKKEDKKKGDKKKGDKKNKKNDDDDASTASGIQASVKALGMAAFVAVAMFTL